MGFSGKSILSWQQQIKSALKVQLCLGQKLYETTVRKTRFSGLKRILPVLWAAEAKAQQWQTPAGVAFWEGLLTAVQASPVHQSRSCTDWFLLVTHFPCSSEIISTATPLMTSKSQDPAQKISSQNLGFLVWTSPKFSKIHFKAKRRI